MADSITFHPGTADLKSGGSGTAVSFELSNKTTSTIRVYWIEPSGAERLYATLASNLSYTQITSTTDAWVVRDSAGQAIVKFQPTQPGLISILSDRQIFTPVYTGTAGNDLLAGTSGDDTFDTGNGNDIVQGGNGNDLAKLPGTGKDYSYSFNATENIYTLSSATYGSKQLSSIEHVAFANRSLQYPTDKLQDLFGGVFKFHPATVDLKTYGSGESAFVEISNKSSTTVKLSYTDVNGTERPYSTLTPGAYLRTASDTQHAWTVKDATDKAIVKLYPSQPGLITILDDKQTFTPTVLGTSGNDVLTGTAGDDSFDTGSGNDSVRGGDGNDQVTVPGTDKDYTFKSGTSKQSLTLTSPIYGTKILDGIETLAFAKGAKLSTEKLDALLKYDVTPIRSSGDASKKVNLVFVSEGYTQADKAAFLADSARFTESLLGASNQRLNGPLGQFSSFFDVSAVFVASNERGVDDPLKNSYVDTIFDTVRYGADGRLGYGDASLVKFVLDRSTAADAKEMVVVLINTALYTNAGGSYVFAAAGNIHANDVMLHEIGHSYASLEDEYVDTALVASSPLLGLDSIHVSASPTNVPWARWLGFQDELGTVGAFEGGYYRATGVWRATQNSKMLNSNQPFSAPQKEAFIKQFYKDVGDYLGWTFAEQEMRAKVPDARLVSFNWTVDGKASGQTERLNVASLMSPEAIVDQTPAAKKLVVTTVDNTGMVRDPAILALSTQTETISLLPGSDKADRIRGTDSADLIVAGAGDDNVDGGKGIDTSVYGGARSDYAIKLTANGAATVQDLRSGAQSPRNEGLDSLVSIERLRFSDKALALDLGGNAASAARLVATLFGKSALANNFHAGLAISLFDQGMTFDQASQVMLTKAFGQNPSSMAVVPAIWKNIVGSDISDSNLAYYTGLLDNKVMTAAQLTTFAASHNLTAQLIDLVGLSSTGWEYQPYIG